MPTHRSIPARTSRAPARVRRDYHTVLAEPGAFRRIVSLHGSGASVHTVAAVLNGGGSRTIDGARWTANTVAHVISNETGGTDVAPVAEDDQGVLAARRVRAVGELGQAITTGQIEVHYQPVVDIVTGEVASVEALVRWRHPTRGLVLPGDFIPLAEDCGLISELTELVARTVIEQTTVWAEAGRPLRCAINVSVSSLCDPRSSARLVALLRHHARRLTVEVTESVLAEDCAVAAVRELAGYGIDIAIDDFGTGYSCLSALKDLPVSTLKIDRSFLRDLDTDTRASAVVETVLHLADALGLDVVAEGIETEVVAAALRDRGVRKAQGFLYARPMPATELDAWLSAALVSVA